MDLVFSWPKIKEKKKQQTIFAVRLHSESCHETSILYPVPNTDHAHTFWHWKELQILPEQDIF